ETDVDCGGKSCLRCKGGKKCLIDDDCLSRACMQGVCAQPGVDVLCDQRSCDGCCLMCFGDIGPTCHDGGDCLGQPYCVIGRGDCMFLQKGESCDPCSKCGGCCDPVASVCLPGSNANACGAGGQCKVCGRYQTCQQGACK